MSPPRTSGFGAMSWLWWPPVALERPARGHEAPGNGHPGGGRQIRPSRTGPRQDRLYGAAIAIVMIQALAACAPASDPAPRCRWPGFRCVIASTPQAAAVATPVLVDNPFWCPRRASP